jgi:hypothetical protein
MCVDYIGLNKACPKDSFPLPRIDQVIDSTAGSELLCFLDAYSGYHQIQMKKSDQLATSFVTPYGTYCYVTMPFCRWISCRKNTGYHATDPKIRMQEAERGRSWIATKHGDGSLECRTHYALQRETPSFTQVQGHHGEVKPLLPAFLYCNAAPREEYKFLDQALVGQRLKNLRAQLAA